MDKNKDFRNNWEDPRIFQEMFEIRKTDTSFKDKGSGLSLLFGSKKYDQQEAREIWFSGIEFGLRRGLEMGVPEGKMVDMRNLTPNQKEFYEKFLELATKHNCSISYYAGGGGMIITDLMP